MKPLKYRQSYAERRLAEKKTGSVSENIELHPKKGQKGGACNRTACQRPSEQDPDGVRWYNHSTQRYYCGNCAWALNNDPFNKKDAQALWGHDLCTLEAE